MRKGELHEMKKYKAVITELLITVLASAISAFTLHIFVFANGFAPSGVDGISTMLQQSTGISAGVFSLLINIPLLVVAFLFISKKYVFYTVLFTVLSSVGMIVLRAVDFYQYIATNEKVLAAVFSGLFLGIRTGMMIRIGASTGGVDIVACIIQKKKYFFHVERIISIICYGIILLSFVVYRNLNSVLLSVVQMFIFEWGAGLMMKDSRDAVEFRIVTKNPDELKEEIITYLKHGATIVESKGAFTGTDSYTIVSVVNERQVPEFLNILKKYPDTFVSYSRLLGVRGNFRWRKTDLPR